MRLRLPFALFVVAVAALTACSPPELDPVPLTQSTLVPNDVAEVEEPEAALYASHATPAPPLEPVAPEVIAHGPRDLKQIALTFDACSTKDTGLYDERILETLEKEQVRATIFVGGSWSKKASAKVRELAQNPLFELGNHSYTHPHMTKKDPTRIREELARTQAEVLELTGVQPKLFRPPFGEYDERVVNIAASLGLVTVQYDLPSGDPDGRATKERLIEWVLRKAQNGSIVVMHLNHRKFHTADALPGIIKGLRDRGYTFATVSDLLAASRTTCQEITN